MATELNIPLNQILYGPPGTGKTYHTINKALEIISQMDQSIDETRKGEISEILKDSSDPKNRKMAKEIFDKFKNEGQIEFITFHQSYSYEEFVEGIKPIPNDNGNVSYKVTQGIFKKICETAQGIERLKNAYNQYVSELYEYPYSLLSSNQKENRPTKVDIQKLADENKGIKEFYTTTQKKKFWILTDSSKTIRVLSETENPSPSPLSLNEFIYDYCQNKKGRTSSYYSVFDDILKESNIKKEDISKLQKTKPYILIIDEINRGNISKIFGELITLIEPSKRIGENEELRVVLPYSGSNTEEDESKELFGVPSNLYIIGTMNTADRSITSIDTALRRRFEFEEMMPNPSKLKTLKIKKEDEEGETEINLKEMLKAINERIEYLCGREKTIGHAYLIEVDSLQSLKNAFQNNIIPLLQEYFHNDYGAIRAVLNNNRMIRDSKKYKKENKNDKDYLAMDGFKNFIDKRGMNEKKVFVIADKDDKKVWEDPKTYIAIYDDEVSKELK